MVLTREKNGIAVNRRYCKNMVVCLKHKFFSFW